MTLWTNAPSREAGSRSYKLMRTPPQTAIKAIILSEFPVGTQLHYHRGRTLPCNPQDCPACKAGQKPRWKGYVYAMSESTRQIVIFEYTERAHETFERFIATYGNCRGAKMTARRTGKRDNSPLLVTFDDGRVDGALLPSPEGLQLCLESMWEIRQQDIPMTNEVASLPYAPQQRFQA